LGFDQIEKTLSEKLFLTLRIVLDYLYKI